MTKAGFEKIKRSAAKLYGPRKLLLCGFPKEAQPKFKTLMQMLGIKNLPLVWITSDAPHESIGDLLALDDGSGEGCPSTLPRAIIASGIQENELYAIMSGCRKAGMKHALWAVLTPTSEKWHLQHLLDELSAEREALSKRTP